MKKYNPKFQMELIKKIIHYINFTLFKTLLFKKKYDMQK